MKKKNTRMKKNKDIQIGNLLFTHVPHMYDVRWGWQIDNEINEKMFRLVSYYQEEPSDFLGVEQREVENKGIIKIPYKRISDTLWQVRSLRTKRLSSPLSMHQESQLLPELMERGIEEVSHEGNSTVDFIQNTAPSVPLTEYNHEEKKEPFKMKSEPIGSMRPREKLIQQVFGKATVRVTRGDISPVKVTRTVQSVARKQGIVSYLKDIYNHTCQICNSPLEGTGGKFLCEVHHIQPIGAKHNGPDITENMLVLCPNHHALMDCGAITIDVEKKVVIHSNKQNQINGTTVTFKHKINPIYIEYHNTHLYKTT